MRSVPAGDDTHNGMKDVLKGKTVIVGLGNVLRGDDGLGPTLVERLGKRLDTPCIDAGGGLERYIGKIARENPETVLFIDAVHLGQEPGAFEFLEPDDLLKAGISTHDLSPGFMLDMFRRMIKGSILLLGVQPQNLSIGEGISGTVMKTLRVLEEKIVAAVKRQTK